MTKIIEPKRAVMNSRLSLCSATSPLGIALDAVSKKCNVDGAYYGVLCHSALFGT
jgi:hypothetical protein